MSTYQQAMKIIWHQNKNINANPKIVWSEDNHHIPSELDGLVVDGDHPALGLNIYYELSVWME